MQPHVVTDFGMEGKGQLISIAYGGDMACRLGEDFDFGADLLYVGRADEVLAHRADVADLGLGDEAAELAAVGVAAHSDGQRFKAGARVIAQVLGQQDEPGACREYGHALLDPRLDGREHAALHQELTLDCALAARQHEAVGLFRKVVSIAQLMARGTECAEHRLVLGEGALHGEHADSLCHVTSPSPPSGAQSPLR